MIQFPPVWMLPAFLSHQVKAALSWSPQASGGPRPPGETENLAGFRALLDWVEEPVLRQDAHSFTASSRVGTGGCLLEDRFTAGQNRRMCLRQGPKVFMQISEDAQPVSCEKVEKKCIVSNTTQKENKTLHSNVQKVPIILQNKVLFLFLHQNQQKRFKQVPKTQFIWR